jgi:ribosomal protein L12E/L44/L45/RPP1/RPP2
VFAHFSPEAASAECTIFIPAAAAAAANAGRKRSYKEGERERKREREREEERGQEKKMICLAASEIILYEEDAID